jgi:hypothetical protein
VSPNGGELREDQPMSLRSLTMWSAAAAVMLTLAGCGGPPWVLSQSPEHIALRWYPDTTPSVAAVERARLHCRSWGKSAELIADAKDGSDEVAQFRCR